MPTSGNPPELLCLFCSALKISSFAVIQITRNYEMGKISSKAGKLVCREAMRLGSWKAWSFLASWLPGLIAFQPPSLTALLAQFVFSC
jgi:hypothetical protein